jgi:hypothetical protein
MTLTDKEILKLKKMKKIILITLDITTLPNEYKTGNLKEDIKRYETDFDVRVIPLDFSKQNLQGSEHFKPIISV